MHDTYLLTICAMQQLLRLSNVTCCHVSYPASDVMKDEWLFKADVIGEALSSTGHDVSRLSTPFVARLSALGNRIFPNILTLVLVCKLLAIH